MEGLISIYSCAGKFSAIYCYAYIGSRFLEVQQRNRKPFGGGCTFGLCVLEHVEHDGTLSYSDGGFRSVKP